MNKTTGRPAYDRPPQRGNLPGGDGAPLEEPAVPLEGVLKEALKDLKTNILEEFAKVCPSDPSFAAVKRHVHDLFDQVEHHLLGRCRRCQAPTTGRDPE